MVLPLVKIFNISSQFRWTTDLRPRSREASDLRSPTQRVSRRDALFGAKDFSYHLMDDYIA